MKKKKNPDLFKNKIQKIFIEAGRKVLNYKQVASRLGIESSEGRNEIIAAIKQLVKEQVLEEIDAGRFVITFIHKFIEGRLDVTQNGAGFVIPDDGSDDIYISPDFMNTALNGDKVKVSLLAQRPGAKKSGEVVEIIKRDKEQFVGILQVHAYYGFLATDDKKMHVDIFIPKEKFGGAKNGDKAIARITEWNSDTQNPVGEIIAVLGKPGEHETEMNAIVAEFGFASKFPEEVELDAEKISDKISKEEVKSRRDFRDTLTFTIDPEDAKDFDDAISFKEVQSGLYEIGVHIADVSHYVTKGSKLNEEAIRRGTSVYLVDRTIPMLPEKLSNGLCSLRPNEDKLTFSVVVLMNDKAEVIETWYGKTIIHSRRRFTYEEAQTRLETGEGDLAKELNIINTLAKILKEQRFSKGAISFETQEVKFRLDANFKPVDVYLKVRKDAHKLIEEFMLLANRKVAEYASKLKQGDEKKTFVYRVHEEPNEDKLTQFNIFASRFGYKIITSGIKAIARSFNKLLEDVEGKPEQNLVQSQAIRTMSKAYYTTHKTLHYGLAFDHYTHFTSPIRRYPDLIAHRLLFEYLNKGKSASEKEIEELCKQSSAMEVKAADAERASVRYKQVEYISDFIGEEFDGIISGVTDWGVYVEISQFKAEGLIRIQNLGDDYFEYDETNKCIIGRSTRKKLTLGDPLRVLVVAADIFKRQIDLAWVDGNLRKSFKATFEKPGRKKDKKAKPQGRKRKR